MLIINCIAVKKATIFQDGQIQEHPALPIVCLGFELLCVP